jgi:heat-inducible transcriptional repressor
MCLMPTRLLFRVIHLIESKRLFREGGRNRDKLELQNMILYYQDFYGVVPIIVLSLEAVIRNVATMCVNHLEGMAGKNLIAQPIKRNHWRNLSLISHYLGVAMSPAPDMTTLKRINLLKYRADRVAAVLFTDEGLIKNKVLSVDSEISQKDLNRIAAYLNSEFAGHSFDEIRLKVMKEMSKEMIRCDSLIAKAMRICQEALYFPYGDLFVSGLSEVLGLPDFADLGKIRELSRAIEDKHTIIKLLDRLAESDGVQVIIGSENSMDEMKKLSMVVSPCKEGNRPIGIVGIIGPTRMNYAKAIYIVENTANFISKMLAGRL